MFPWLPTNHALSDTANWQSRRNVRADSRLEFATTNSLNALLHLIASSR